jgi:serine/threonine protein kinase
MNEINLEYKDKYLKYKKKYLSLKEEVGGAVLAKQWKKLTGQKSCSTINNKNDCNKSYGYHGHRNIHNCYWYKKKNKCKRRKEIKFLGKGAFGKVVQLDENTVVKYIDKKQIEEEEMDIQKEIKLLKNIKYPFSSYLKSFDGNEKKLKNYGLHLNLIEGKELKYYIDKNLIIDTDKQYIITQMLLFNYYNGSNGIIHLDLKPENCIYNKSNNQLYIIDYGLSECIGGSSICEGELKNNENIYAKGTPSYLPPSMRYYKDKIFVNYLDDYYTLAIIIFGDLYRNSNFYKNIYKDWYKWNKLSHEMRIGSLQVSNDPHKFNVFNYLQRAKIYNIDAEPLSETNSYKLFKWFAYEYFDRYQNQIKCLNDEKCNYHMKNIIDSFSIFGINNKDVDLISALRYIDNLHEDHMPNTEIDNLESVMAKKRKELWEHITKIAEKIKL